MKVLLMSLSFAFLSNAFAVEAPAEFKSNAKNGNVIFEAVGKPAMIKIKGESEPPKSKLVIAGDNTSLESILDLDHLNTGIEMRDEHMKERYLETKKFPTAKLTISTLKVPASWEQTPTDINNQEFAGILNMHGKDVPVQGTFSLNSQRVANAEFKIKLTDYGIEIPSYLGIKVAETVTIKTQIQFEK